jgi:hypothetical protein
MREIKMATKKSGTQPAPKPGKWVQHPDPALERIGTRFVRMRNAMRELHEQASVMVELIDEYEQQPRSWVWRTIRAKTERLRDSLAYELERKDPDDDPGSKSTD